MAPFPPPAPTALTPVVWRALAGLARKLFEQLLIARVSRNNHHCRTNPLYSENSTEVLEVPVAVVTKVGSNGSSARSSSGYGSNLANGT